MSVTRYDRAPFKATKTNEGFVQDSPVLSRVGVFAYRQPDGKIRHEFRPPEEVFHADHLASIFGKPITNEHHGQVRGDTAGGKVIGACLSPGRQDADEPLNLRGDIIIHDAVHTVSKRELSLGYTLDLEETPGEFNGVRYDAVQRNLRVNHLALVAKGRAGNARLNLDAADAVLATTEEVDTMSLVKIRLDSGIEYEAAPEVVQALTAAQAATKVATERADTVTAERDTLKAKVETHESSLAQLRLDAVAEVKARAALEAAATDLGAKFAQDAKDSDIRVAVIKAVRGDAIDLAGKSDAYVEASYDMAVADGLAAKKKAGQNRADADKPPAHRADGEQKPASAAAARGAYVASFNTVGAK